MNDRLTRSKDDRVISGVCGGLARYFGLDATLIRILFVLITLAGGAGVLLYFILLILMPLDTSVGSDINYVREENKQRTILLAGAGLVIFGIWNLLSQTHILSWLNWQHMWPLVLVAIGISMIVGKNKGSVL
ncbi:MAG: PspC domain-containing protein [Anaerolineales bacterium]|nr:PspC domain-containing protein [Anaerolineales bacterium]